MDVTALDDRQRHRIVSISDSHLRITGRRLVADEGDPVQMLWSAPFAIVAHGTETDPVFFFGNRKALQLFEMDFGNFTLLPSRLSAEPLLRKERSQLLERVMREGIIEDYAGVRISSTGRRFRISNASVWNVTDSTGAPVGQAAAFADWVYLT
ncbi:MAG: MEKHLA domain-containing protein [Hyphomicrobiaceae bacterium]